MFANSSPVHSNQPGLHPRLTEVVLRHVRQATSAPLLEPHWWPALRQWWMCGAAPVLDLGCGCGESVRNLQRLAPAGRVLGIDASRARLQRGGLWSDAPSRDLQVDCGWLHGDSVTLLRLLAREAWRSPRVCLLYPNPWPKAAHLLRRWHGHPVFATLLQVAQIIELRSNWPLYVHEFAAALDLCGWQVQIETVQPQAPVSRFELKYAASGHALWRLTAIPVVAGADYQHP